MSTPAVVSGVTRALAGFCIEHRSTEHQTGCAHACALARGSCMESRLKQRCSRCYRHGRTAPTVFTPGWPRTGRRPNDSRRNISSGPIKATEASSLARFIAGRRCISTNSRLTHAQPLEAHRRPVRRPGMQPLTHPAGLQRWLSLLSSSLLPFLPAASRSRRGEDGGGRIKLPLSPLEDARAGRTSGAVRPHLLSCLTPRRCTCSFRSESLIPPLHPQAAAASAAL